MSTSKKITAEQKNELLNKGIDELLIDVLSKEQLLELLEKSQKESLTIKVKKVLTNICTELVKSFGTEKTITFSKKELIEQICLLSQKNFFEITNNNKEFILTNTEHAKVFLLLKDYEFKTVLANNKQIKACPDLKSKNVLSIQLWLKRGVQILNEIKNEKHAKYFNGYDLEYKMEISNDIYTFTKN